MQQITIENNRPVGIKEDGTKQKYYSEEEIKMLLEKLRLKLGMYGLYDESYPEKWFNELI